MYTRSHIYTSMEIDRKKEKERKVYDKLNDQANIFLNKN